MIYNEPYIKVIESNMGPQTAEDFIKERVEYRNFDQFLTCEIEEFNKMQERIAEMNGFTSYEYVGIGRHNPDISTDYYYPYVGICYLRKHTL
jgi:hypothetical protein